MLVVSVQIFDLTVLKHLSNGTSQEAEIDEDREYGTGEGGRIDRYNLVSRCVSFCR